MCIRDRRRFRVESLHFLSFCIQSRNSMIVPFLIFPSVSFSTFTPFSLSIKSSSRTNVSLYAVIVLALAPLSSGRYLAIKSDMYLEKSVGLIVPEFREHVQAYPVHIVDQVRVHVRGQPDIMVRRADGLVSQIVREYRQRGI